MDAVCKALREMADMQIHLGKTKVMLAQESIPVDMPTESDLLRTIAQMSCKSC